AGVYSPSMTFTSTTWAALAVAIHPVVIPAAPTGLAAKERSTTSVNLTWTNPGNVLVDDLLAVTTGSCGTGTQIKENVTANETVKGPTNGVKYCFAVWAVNASGVSASFASLTYQIPLSPTGFSVTNATQTTLWLAWTLPHGTVTNVSLEWGTSCSTLAPFSNLTTTGGSLGVVSGATVTDALAGQTYCLAIGAWNASGPSAWAFTNGTTLAPTPGGGGGGNVGGLIVDVALVGIVAIVIMGLSSLFGFLGRRGRGYRGGSGRAGGRAGSTSRRAP